MMKLSADFRTRTNVGLTQCYHGETIRTDYRDCANVDFVVSFIKKVFSKVNYDPCVTFSCNDTVGRIFENYTDGKKGYTFLLFDHNGESNAHWVEKLTAVDIKVFYLNCADKAIEYEKVA